MLDLVKLKEDLRLTASLETMTTLHGQLEAFLKPLDEADRNLSLFLLERMVLGSKGHLVTLKMGHNVWSAKKCSVCGVPIDAEGQAFWMLSRWEQSSIMLTLCDLHARETFEIDFDLLTGSPLSELAPS
jgi:hypothetical protein